jgi:hypothetical protein
VHFDSEPNQKHDTNFHNITLRMQLNTHLLHTKIDITKRKFMVWKKLEQSLYKVLPQMTTIFIIYAWLISYFQNNNPEHTQLKRKICRETFYGGDPPSKKKNKNQQPKLNWHTSSFSLTPTKQYKLTSLYRFF